MIIYDSRNLCFIWRWKGSSIPKSLFFSLPSVGLTVLWHFVLDQFEEDFNDFLDIGENGESTVWAAITIVLGMLLASRTSSAYNRFWEGITLVQQMRAEWFESTSNLVAFSSVGIKINQDDRRVRDVNDFHHILVRMMSLMHGTALRQIGGFQEDFEVLDVNSLDDDSIEFLTKCEVADVNRVEVLLHWIQVLVTEGAADGVLAVPAPILTRAYQTLSRGMVNLHNARKLADVPFPFPLSQMIIVLLLFHNIFTPFFIASVVKNLTCAILVCVVPIFGMWSITFIAAELEQPFGHDVNDLPLSVLQYEFNTSLLMLLDKESMRAPHLVGTEKKTVMNLRRDFGNSASLGKSMTCLMRKSIDLEEEDLRESISRPSFPRLMIKGVFSPSKNSQDHRTSLEVRKKKTLSFERTKTLSFCSEKQSYGFMSDVDLGSISEDIVSTGLDPSKAPALARMSSNRSTVGTGGESDTSRTEGNRIPFPRATGWGPVLQPAPKRGLTSSKDLQTLEARLEVLCVSLGQVSQALVDFVRTTEKKESSDCFTMTAELSQRSGNPSDHDIRDTFGHKNSSASSAQSDRRVIMSSKEPPPKQSPHLQPEYHEPTPRPRTPSPMSTPRESEPGDALSFTA